MAKSTYEEYSDAITVQALKDPAFRKELIADPVATFEKYLGQPMNTKIFVHENSPTETHFVLPPVVEHGELSEDDLEKVAGGLALPLPTSPFDNPMIFAPINPTRQNYGW